MATLFIDGKSHEVSSGRNLLEVCLSLGLNLPYFCWHPALGSVGACRQCAVKIFKDENDKKGRLVMSCMEPVTNNQHISINDAEAREFRDHVIEWLMTNHPHDCAVCDEGGSCHLQDMTVMTGHSYRKFRYKKRTYKNQNLGPFINHEMNRCIQCYRCVRFYKDYAGGKDLDSYASKNKVYFGRHEDGALESEFSGNLAEVCPTGVFTDKTLKQHYTRKWDLTMAPSICHHCSLGCNIIAGERYGSLRMIANRYHGEVNGYFLCDRGRFGYEFVNSTDRIKIPVFQNGSTEEVNITLLFKKIATLKNKNIIGVGSPRASLESNFALKKLVGESNFYQGVSENEFQLLNQVHEILLSNPAKVYSMKEVEKADAAFVLGEDLTNTAPMLALSIRQAVRQEPLKKVQAAKIPLWNDAAARELIQHDRGSLFLGTITTTKLDDVASASHHASPDDLARLGFAVANNIDSSSPAVPDLSSYEQSLAKRIADALMKAERPVVISGTSCQSIALLQATSNIVLALYKKNPNTGIVLSTPECNSLGLSMLGGQSLNKAFDVASKGDIDGVIVLENDLYRQGYSESVNQFISQCKDVVVLDHTRNETTQKASVLVPTSTFAEADGTLVNNEGRAQRFFQVYEPGNGIRESWRWLIQISEALKDNPLTWKNQNEIAESLAKESKLFEGIDTIAPPINVLVNGQRIPRQPHRYSGRTAMLANINVSEPKPAEDPDSSMSYTMEGYRGQPPSSMIPFFWSPGWNSVQSVNKFQEQVGEALSGGDPGLKLFSTKNEKGSYFANVPEKFQSVKGKLLAVAIHHIFGSEELSSKSSAVAKRVPESYIMINDQDASSYQLNEGDKLKFEISKQVYQLPIRLNKQIVSGLAGLPLGIKDVPFLESPVFIELKLES